MIAQCKICGGDCHLFDERIVRRKYSAIYAKCKVCEFVFVTNPDWLKEAYAEPINRTDTGYISRNQSLARKVATFLRLVPERGNAVCDYGGGYGIVVRMLRDRGVNAWLWEPYTQNLFAPGFSLAKLDEHAPWGLITAFEVMEHLEDPMEAASQLLKLTDTFYFSTELQPSGFRKGSDWYYLGLDHGQHVSLFSKRSIEKMAGRLGANYHTDGAGLHLITRRRGVAGMMFMISSKEKIARIFGDRVLATAIHQDRDKLVAEIK